MPFLAEVIDALNHASLFDLRFKLFFRVSLWLYGLKSSHRASDDPSEMADPCQAKLSRAYPLQGDL